MLKLTLAIFELIRLNLKLQLINWNMGNSTDVFIPQYGSVRPLVIFSESVDSVLIMP